MDIRSADGIKIGDQYLDLMKEGFLGCATRIRYSLP
jgi:hypothetical protein